LLLYAGPQISLAQVGEAAPLYRLTAARRSLSHVI
jgi:hypothetical protein